MSIDTLLKMGHYNSAQHFLTYIKGILKSKDDSFQIIYGIRGKRELIENQLTHLAGYENSKPVRIGLKEEAKTIFEKPFSMRRPRRSF